MNEDQVLQAVIDWFSVKGWSAIYKTQPVSEGAIGGVDAILSSPNHRRFIFIDAKGEAKSAIKRSAQFNNLLGALVKRIRVEAGYSGNEKATRFVSKEMRKLVAGKARHDASDYVLALTRDYEETARQSLDPKLAEMLHIRVLVVESGNIRELLR